MSEPFSEKSKGFIKSRFVVYKDPNPPTNTALKIGVDDIEVTYESVKAYLEYKINLYKTPEYKIRPLHQLIVMMYAEMLKKHCR